MLYNPPVKGEDGLYFVKALTDEKRKCLVQVNGVKVVDVSGEFVFDLSSNDNMNKIQEVDTGNLVAAVENCETWFKRKLSDNVITAAYTPATSVRKSQATHLMSPGYIIQSRKCIDIESYNQVRCVMSFSNSLDFGSPRKILVHLGMLSRSGFTMTRSWILYPEGYAFYRV